MAELAAPRGGRSVLRGLRPRDPAAGRCERLRPRLHPPMRAPVWDDSDPLQLRRVVVGDWTGATFAQRIAKEFLR
jgi:hypothetical protein